MKDKKLEIKITVGTKTVQDKQNGKIWCESFNAFFKVLLIQSDFKEIELEINMTKLEQDDQNFMKIHSNVDKESEYLIDDLGHSLVDAIEFSAQVADSFITTAQSTISKENMEEFIKAIPSLVIQLVKRSMNEEEIESGKIDMDKLKEDFKHSVQEKISKDNNLNNYFDSRKRQMGLDN